MTRLLAGVTSVSEAAMALEAGAHIIDITDPAAGALGAREARVVRDIVEAVGSFATTSAATGEFPAMPLPEIVAAAQATARLGVGHIRVGFWGTPRDADCARALSRLAASSRLVAVLFADLPQDPGLLDILAAVGFSGVMYDTAEKRGSPLRLLKTETELALFVRRARNLGLLCGLAGKLRVEDIPALLTLRPDFLGLRGALCHAGARTAPLAPDAIGEVCAAMAAPQREPPGFSARRVAN